MQTILVVGSRLGAPRGLDLNADSYAIPVYELANKTPRLLPVASIAQYVGQFRAVARVSPDHFFLVTCVGCGEGGYQPGQIADLFTDMPDNVYLQSRLAYGLK
jgi:hypothetical protein